MNQIVPASLEHAQALAPRLRKADIREIEASSGGNPEDVLVLSLAMSSVAWAWLKDGEVMAVFGAASKPGSIGVGIPWLLAAEGADKAPIYFLKNSRRYIARCLEVFPVLTNHVDCRHAVAIQWLHWLGFALCEVEPFHGIQRMPFIRFQLTRGGAHV